MFVKIIRHTPKSVVSEIYEPRSIEFRRLNVEGLPKVEYPENAAEELLLKFNDDYAQSIILYSGDEVWLTSNTGQTVDRWKI